MNRSIYRILLVTAFLCNSLPLTIRKTSVFNFKHELHLYGCLGFLSGTVSKQLKWKVLWQTKHCNRQGPLLPLPQTVHFAQFSQNHDVPLVTSI